MNEGILEPNTISWGTPLPFVAMKEGCLCLSIDYRALNLQMINN